MDTEQFLTIAYQKIIDIAEQKGELPDEMTDQLRFRNLETLDELEQAYNDLLEALNNKDLYNTLYAISRVEKALENESDMNKRAHYTEELRKLTAQLEQLTLSKGA
jgi:protein subunit release factor A